MAISSSEKINWQVGPSGNTPLTADNLNKINNNTADAIDAIENNVNGILSGSIPAAKATSATSDANGNTISTTYATKSSVDNIISGTTTVKKAQQDASGNIITSTYCTKSEAYERANEVRTDVGNGTVVPTKVDIGTDSKIQNQLISSIFESNSSIVKKASTAKKVFSNESGDNTILTYYNATNDMSKPTSGWVDDESIFKRKFELGGALELVYILFRKQRSGIWWHYAEFPNTYGALLTAIPYYTYGPLTFDSSFELSCDNAPNSCCAYQTGTGKHRIYIRSQNDNGKANTALLAIFVHDNDNI